MRLAARYAARSDIGRHRQTNEDAWLARPPVFAVADGMGGAQAGEVASRVALETLAAHSLDVDPLDREVAGAALLAAAHEANQRVWQFSREHASRAGMGTTLTALALCTDGVRLVHIGDSRAYLLRGGELTQLSDDHSLVGEMVRSGELAAPEAAGHPLRSILSRALGTEPDPQIDLLDMDLAPGDVLLLCSDGLTGPLPDSRIALLLAEPDPEEAARRLVDAALREGGPDNITVVVVCLDEAPQPEEGGSGAEAAAKAAAVDAAADATRATDPKAAGPDAAAPKTAGQDAAVPRKAESDASAPPSPAPGDAVPPSPPTGDASVPPGPAASKTAGSHADMPPTPPTPTMIAPLSDLDDVARPADGEAHQGTREKQTTPAPTERPFLGGAAAPAAAASASSGAAAKRGRRRWVVTLVTLAVVLAVLAAAVLVVGQLEWVGVADDGVVTVNRGLPWDFVGVRLYREHQRTTVVYAGLSPAQRQLVDRNDIGWRGSGSRLVTQLGGSSP